MAATVLANATARSRLIANSRALADRLRVSVASCRPPMTVANMLTLARILMIPCIIWLFLVDADHRFPITACLVAVASLTDLLDGAIARWTKQSSILGEFLDPVADKLLVTTVLILLVHRDAEVALVLPAVLLIVREVSVSALREWSARHGASSSTRVSRLAKAKTALQMVALVTLLASAGASGPLWNTGIALLWLAAIISVITATQYFRRVPTTLWMGQ